MAETCQKASFAVAFAGGLLGCTQETSSAPAATESAIVSGVEAQPGAWLGVVALINRSGDQACGGTLVADTWVLTAGHCLAMNRPMGGIPKVVIGRHQLSSPEGEEVAVAEVLRHPAYGHTSSSAASRNIADNDLALLRLERPSDAPKARVARIEEIEVLGAGVEVTAVGWGLTDDALGTDTDVLRQVTVPLITDEACATPEYERFLTPNMLCTGSLGNHEAVCGGDSGGPLFATVGGQVVQLGIVSWSSCGSRNLPSVFTRIANYLDWIHTTTGAVR
jgi:secreted trypsin-like serine protease